MGRLGNEDTFFKLSNPNAAKTWVVKDGHKLTLLVVIYPCEILA